MRWGINLAAAGLLVIGVACGSDDDDDAADSRATTGQAASSAVEISSGQSSAEPLRIGGVQPLTGPIAVLGAQSSMGMEIAVELINDEGGVNGRPVELVLRDAPEVEDARIQAEQLVVDDGIVPIVGTVGSAYAIAASTAATRAGGFYFEVSSAAKEITTSAGEHAVKVPWTLDDVGAAAIPSLDHFSHILDKPVENLRVGFLHEDSAYGASMAESFTAAIAAASLPEPLVNVTYNAASTSDFTPILAEIRDADLDVLFASSYIDDTKLFLQQFVEQELDVPALVGFSSGYADATLPEQLPANVVEGLYVIDSNVAIADGLSEEGLRLRNEMFERYEARGGSGRPSTHVAYAFTGTYAALRHVLDGIDTTDPEAILEKAMSVDLPQGSLPMGFGLKFGELDDPAYPHINSRTLISLNQWQDGEIVTVHPAEFAVGEAVPWMPLS